MNHFLLFAFLSSIAAATAFHQVVQEHGGVRNTCTRRFMSTAAVGGSASSLLSVLKKPSKVLSVGLEYSGGKLSANEISILSMQLRKCKAAAIWSKNIDAVKKFATEQQSALGDFPGPCPIIFHGPVEDAEEALQAGASAVVLTKNDLDSLSTIQGEIVWKVLSKEDVESILEKTEQGADVFWVDGVDNAIVEAIPPKALWIADIEPMKAEGAEIAEGKRFKSQGCGSILVRDACVGDSEDLEYAQYAIGGLTSKASSEFKFSGLTGSTNGHFGGIQSNSKVQWQRKSM